MLFGEERFNAEKGMKVVPGVRHCPIKITGSTVLTPYFFFFSKSSLLSNSIFVKAFTILPVSFIE